MSFHGTRVAEELLPQLQGWIKQRHLAVFGITGCDPSGTWSIEISASGEVDVFLRCELHKTVREDDPVKVAKDVMGIVTSEPATPSRHVQVKNPHQHSRAAEEVRA